MIEEPQARILCLRTSEKAEILKAHARRRIEMRQQGLKQKEHLIRCNKSINFY